MKKYLYSLALAFSLFLLYSCSKSNGQTPEENKSQDVGIEVFGEDASGDNITGTSYIIVSGLTMSQLSAAVKSRLSTYKLTGGPFMYHCCGNGVEHYAQAMYK